MRLTRYGGPFALVYIGYPTTGVRRKDRGTAMTGGGNPRSKNGNLRRKHRARFRAMDAPCGICGGKIHYDEPSDAKHPLSFVIDEIIPVSKYWLGGYPSREACAQDWNNLQAAHYGCNAAKGARVRAERKIITKNISDGEW